MEIVAVKQTFLDSIDTIITGAGFVKVSDGYNLKTIEREPEQNMMFNNRHMVIPGRTYDVIRSIIFVGEGCVTNEDGSNQREFTQIQFKIVRDKDCTLSHVECFYWDDIPFFEFIFNQFKQ